MDWSVAHVQRRFLALQALRWLPVGFVAPILVLVLTRSLPLARVGPLLAVYGATTALLELPTGGLADRVGRRPVLLASSVVSVLFYAGLLVTDDMWGLTVAVALGGVSRALDSGPLEAWFVDETRALDPEADLRPGLARAGAINGVALAVGAVAGGLLPWLADGRIVAAVWAALGCQLVHLAAVALLLREHRPDRRADGDRPPSTRAVLAGAFGAGAPGRPHLVFAGTVTLGVGLVAVESLWQPRLVDLLARDDATVVLGVLLAVAFAASAAGAALAPGVARRLESRIDPSTAGQAAGGLALLGLAATTTPLVAGVLFIGFYALLGVIGPLRADLLHRQVTAGHRSTALSGDSLALQAGGFVAALTLPPLADAHGIPLAWTIGGLVFALGGAFYLGIRNRG